jgi:cytoplasmic iron level regulating protein YaaA (DUF328/UPF0246 family)
VLILLPASESKTPIARGKPLDPAGLSFPSLAPTRAAVLDALIEVSAEPDATRRLGVPPTLGDVVRDNVTILDAPAAPAGTVYSGVLYDSIGLADVDAASRRRARAWIVVISALWGAVRLGDRIPPYRLNMCGRLPGLAHLPQVWQEPLADVLPAAAGSGVIADFRVADFATAWRSSGVLAERTVAVRIRHRDGTRGAGSYSAKHTGGLVVRRIVTDSVDPRDPEGLAKKLLEHFDVDLREPRRPGQTWELRVAEATD